MSHTTSRNETPPTNLITFGGPCQGRGTLIGPNLLAYHGSFAVSSSSREAGVRNPARPTTLWGGAMRRETFARGVRTGAYRATLSRGNRAD